jgi:hypothetical protein
MKKILILGVALMFALTSCNDDDTNTPPPPAGTYSLVRVQGGLVGGNWQLSRDKVIWNISTAQDSVTITNNAPQNGTPSGLASGKYAYKVENTAGTNGACDVSLSVNNDYFGCYTKTNDTIKVNDLHADGFLYTFVKN